MTYTDILWVKEGGINFYEGKLVPYYYYYHYHHHHHYYYYYVRLTAFFLGQPG